MIKLNEAILSIILATTPISSTTITQTTPQEANAKQLPVQTYKSTNPDKLAKKITNTYYKYLDDRLDQDNIKELKKSLRKSLSTIIYKDENAILEIKDKIQNIIYDKNEKAKSIREFKKDINKFIRKIDEESKINNILKEYYLENTINKYIEIKSGNKTTKITKKEKKQFKQIEIINKLRMTRDFNEKELKYLATNKDQFESRLKILRKFLNQKHKNPEETIYEYIKKKNLIENGYSLIEAKQIISGNYEKLTLTEKILNRAKKVLKPTNFLNLCEKYDTDPAKEMAIIATESMFNPTATSWMGAYGLRQLLKSTAEKLGVDRHDINQNLEGGIMHIKNSYEELKGKGYSEDELFTLALIDYNAGQTNRNRYLKTGYLPEETRKYIPKVKKYYELFKEIDIKTLLTE
ncbi:lytic transglycosylase domain-containing protein [Candidatus Woesearchaeota archaeon]|nr:lytic transglycosylase domain-containing protein [Candidatus Woesearchaeota archaeon]